MSERDSLFRGYSKMCLAMSFRVLASNFHASSAMGFAYSRFLGGDGRNFSLHTGFALLIAGCKLSFCHCSCYLKLFFLNFFFQMSSVSSCSRHTEKQGL